MDGNITLSDEQKAMIKQNGDALGWNILKLTRMTFEDQALTGRHVEGKLVKKFIKEVLGEEPQSNSHANIKSDFALSEEHKRFIDNNWGSRFTSTTKLAAALFPKLNQDLKKANLSIESKTIRKYIKEEIASSNKFQDAVKNTLTDDNLWVAPKSIHYLIPIINKYLNSDFKKDSLKEREKDNLKAALGYLNNLLLSKVLNRYEEIDEKDIFLNSFIRGIWDKPDLTVGEVEQYVDFACERVRLYHLQTEENVLRNLLREATEDESGMIRHGLTEAIDKVINSIDKTSTRINKLLASLEGNRKERLEQKQKETHSLLALVEVLQKEENRLEIIRQEEINRREMEDSIKEVEEYSESIVKFYGLSRNEILN